MRLSGKIALVTGSARGIGRAIAETFAAEGARVIVSDINDGPGQAVADSLRDGLYQHLDVSREEDWRDTEAMIRDRFGQLHVVVNNAGIIGATETPGPHDPENLDMASWRTVHGVNAEGVALGCKYAIGLMKEAGGSIINISSRSGNVGIPWMVAYAASKAAVRNHTKSVALYCCERGYPIRCNSIHPGAILTPMWDPMLGEGDARDQAVAGISRQVPMGRMGTPMDVAWGAVYLAADESAYLSGTELYIDGGIMAGSVAAPEPEEQVQR